MPLEIIRNDITKVKADAIVNTANSSLLGGGGVDGAIHRAAGPGLLAECRTLGGCKVGQAKITKAYELPSKYVIHTVGPIWKNGEKGEEKLLADCYRNSLALALEHNLKSIAFPLISTGEFGYPKDRAIKTAISIIGDFLLKYDMKVLLVVFDTEAFTLSEKLFSSITQYIDEKYVASYPPDRRHRNRELSARSAEIYQDDKRLMQFVPKEALVREPKRYLADVVKQIGETFSQRLLRLIDEKGLTDSDVYKKANIDRKLFSKIRINTNYKPSKPTAIAFAIALKLNLDETKDLLLKAGFALSNCSKFDVIVQYFIEEGNYNIFEINEALFAFDQQLLSG